MGGHLLSRLFCVQLSLLQGQHFQRGVCLVILETMVTTTVRTYIPQAHMSPSMGSTWVQYPTPAQTCDKDVNLHNTLPCEHMQCRAMHLFYKSSHGKQCTARSCMP